jgi:LuxR family transcriptional regulator, quorum-sensing system regulator BjaR1
MLAMVERYFDVIRKASADHDIIDIIKDIAADFHFRSGYLIEYTEDLGTALHVLDSNAAREGWWQEYIAKGLRTKRENISEMLSRGGVQLFDGRRFTDPDDPLLVFAQKHDMVEATLVPVSHGGALVGLGGFSGVPDLNAQQQMALQLLVYAVFAQVRTFRNIGVVTQVDALTPREKEVIALSADGLTSVEIALQLGMSARTVNQHVDNVSSKLGTKNRAHTVAEVIRHNLL